MNGKIIATIVFISMLSGAYTGNIVTLQPINNDASAITIHLNFSSPMQNGTKIFMKVCNSYIRIPGMPVLPEYKEVIKFPFGTKITSIGCKVYGIKRMEGLKVEMAPFPRWIGNGSIIKYEVNETTFPSSWYDYRIGSGMDDDQRVVFLSFHIYPVRYENGKMKYISSASIKIRYEEASKNIGDSYDFVIIAPSEYKEALQPLAEHKERHGIRTKIVTLDEIYGGKYFECRGRDEPEKIKYFLKDAIENWGIKYVMLAGDIEKVPSRRVYSFVWGKHGMYSDYYYADIYDGNGSFCSWDSNGNNKFGEVGEDGDKVDLYADLYVGRIACYDLNELEIVVNKIIRYEESNKSWFSRMILMGGDTFPWNDIMEGEVVNQYVENATPEFEHIKIQTSLRNFKPRKINEIWSQGAGLICYSGHGFEYGFGTHPPHRRRMIKYYTPYLLGLKNGEKLPVIFFDACLTAKLDYHMLENPHIPCFAWCLVKKPDGGAIATIGATESATTTVSKEGPIGEAGYLDYHFFMAYEHGTTPSKMLVKAKNDYLNDIAEGNAEDWLYEMTIEQFILLGDPTLELQ